MPRVIFIPSFISRAPHTTPEGYSRQGLYTLTPDGKLLTFTNTWNMGPFLEYMWGGVDSWNALPEAERRAGAHNIPVLDPLSEDPMFARNPPEHGAIIKVYSRILEQGDEGELRHCKAEGEDVWGLHAAVDHLWVKYNELQGMVPADDNAFPFPDAVAKRIVRHNLVDNTRGETTRWELNEILAATLTCQRTAQDADGWMNVSITGNIDLQTKDAKRGHQAALLGNYVINEQGQLKSFKLLSLGEHWGDGLYTPHARPGRTPLGIAFHLVSGTLPEDRIPPQGIRKPSRYW